MRVVPLVAGELRDALTDVVTLAMSGVPGCTAASVTLDVAGAAGTVAASGARARQVDAAQLRHGVGPCLVAARQRDVVRCDDYATEQRWPGVADEIAATGIGSSISLPLDGGDVTGALNLCSDVPHGFDAAAELAARALARQGSITLRHLGPLPREEAEHRPVEAAHHALVPPPGLACAVRYLPSGDAGPLGGDWYDVFPLPDGAVAVAIGDVMGHDRAAVAGMGRVRTVLRSYAYECENPSMVLDRMDRLVQDFDLTEIATALYARLVVEPGGALMLFSNAGHPSPLLRHPDGTVVPLLGGRSPLIGAPRPLPRTESAVALPAGSTLLLYTDGLVEGRDRDATDDVDELQWILAEHGAGTSLEALCDRIVDALGAEHDDDVTVLALRVDGSVAVSEAAKPAPALTKEPMALARHVSRLLAAAERDCDVLHAVLTHEQAQHRVTEEVVQRSLRCRTLVEDALLFGAVDLAAALGVPDCDLPG